MTSKPPSTDSSNTADAPEPTGMKKGLTSYGDAGFSLFLRKAFIMGAGFTDKALDRPVIGIVALHEHWYSNGDAAAQAQQQALNGTRAVFQQYPMITAMKAAIAWQAKDAGWATVRPPLVELDTQQAQQLQHSLSQRGFTIPNATSLASAA